LIYERLEGISMLQDLNAHPWMLFQHSRSLAELQVQIHQQSITGMPIKVETPVGLTIKRAKSSHKP
jgi:hypothetical protein